MKTPTTSHLGARLGMAALAACTLAVGCASPGTRSPGDGTMGASAATPAAATPATAAAATPANCTPLETRSPNATGQTPAFAGQTRTCGVKSNVEFEVVELTKALVNPWAVEPLPDGRLLVTERPGRMRIVSATGQVGEPLAGIPEVAAGGQGGLLDVALAPTFAQDRTIFWSYSEPREGGNGTAIARGVLSTDGTRVENVQVIFRVMPTYAGRQHFGSRIAFGPDGMLYSSFGDRSNAPMRPHAQQLDGHLGKVIRIRPDGSVPPDNPYVGRADAKPEIWTSGHRNPQSLAFDAQGRLWQVEHGTRGGDELNLIEKSKNYGWPLQAYGVEYSGQPITSPLGAASPHVAGMQEPVYFWDPVIAPSGLQIYTGNAFPAWRGSMFIGGMGSRRLVRLVLDGTRVVGEEHLLADRNQRVRDVRQGPDGLLYLVTDEATGAVWKLVPKGR
ncbi:MAG TPA: PQQ-dependent sugar dehydrogenase [Gemmatimonadaceae bacterium]|nr:PQQ-dependent sugar dehydrogenase [Gemmatimonadaceae bacterium]